MDLVLSIFPGIDLLGRAFEEQGWCVVRGPDVLWGGDIRAFRPPAGVFAGVIGGPPCQEFSPLARLVRATGRKPRSGNLIPEFERVVALAQPDWWLMENVPQAPVPQVAGYSVQDLLLNNRWLPAQADTLVGAEQQRKRRFSVGTRDGRRVWVEVAVLEAPLHVLTIYGGHGPSPSARDAAVVRAAAPALLGSSRGVPVRIGGSGKVKRTAMPTVTASHGYRRHAREDGQGGHIARYSVEDAAELQGLPRDILREAPFTKQGKLQALANGVPLPMGRAMARAIRRAYGNATECS